LEQHRTENAMTNLPGSGEFHAVPNSLPCLLPTILCAAVDWAVRIRADAVVIGSSWIGQRDAHGRVILGDDPSLDRIRPTLQAFRFLMESRLPDKTKIALETPLMDLSLEEAVKLGERYELPLEHTWSCETGAGSSCGKCPGCVDRKTAFVKSDIADPLQATTAGAH
jgi:7-cyano-7-deazaguanine synthase in queuosine biosynthesis